MEKQIRILVVEDQEINRKILKRILEEEYQVYEAKNGEEAVSFLCSTAEQMDGILLDLAMPVMDGYKFLEIVGGQEAYGNVPIIVLTENNNKENELRALELGAWDFVSKPYDAKIIRFRLQNALQRSRLDELQQVEEKLKYDALTGIYSREKFFQKTAEMIKANPQYKFVLLRVDIDRFQLINSFFGIPEGDNLLKYIAINLWRLTPVFECCTFGRMEADVFCVCVPYRKEKVEEVLQKARKILEAYNTNYDIVPSVGMYIIEDTDMPLRTIYDRAGMAAKQCKGNYIQFFAYYDETLAQQISIEHEITNEMNSALLQEQFTIYLQPKVNLFTKEPEGAEALVRWVHPTKGIIAPIDFIPVFEKNGFIMKLDYYVWEKVCKLLRKWLDEGENPRPVSVNISRVNFYNPNICNTIIYLVEKYNIPCELLQLELTESAYTDNPKAMKAIMKRLQGYGFTMLMDDFGSGYSSLNMLKDITVDILKLDMQFLENSEIMGRGENILASIVRMAKWLNIPVVVEGVETREQAEFLKSLGCDYAQGYYYAKPMEVRKYEEFLKHHNTKMESKREQDRISAMKIEEFWTKNSQVNLLFNSIVNAVGIYELYQDKLELIRANEGFFEVTHDSDAAFRRIAKDVIKVVIKEDRALVMQAFRDAIGNEKPVTCIYRRYSESGVQVYIKIKIKHIMSSGERHLFYGAFDDITAEHKAVQEVIYHKQLLESAMIGSKCSVWEWDIKKHTAHQSLHSHRCQGAPDDYDNFPEILFLNNHYHETSVPAAREMFQRILEGERVVQRNLQVYDENKNEYWWENACYTTIYDEHKKPIRAVAVGRDVTDAKEKDQQLEKEIQKLQLVLENSDIQIWEYDIVKKESIQQAKTEEEYKIPHVIENAPQAIVESGLIHPDSVGEYLRIHEEVSKGAPKAEADICYIHPEREERLHVTYLTLYDGKGNPVSAIGCARK